MDISTDSRLERGLWITFGVLFAVLVTSVYVPVEPIIGVLPLWSVLALVAILATVVIAAIAGIGYGWPSEGR